MTGQLACVRTGTCTPQQSQSAVNALPVIGAILGIALLIVILGWIFRRRP